MATNARHQARGWPLGGAALALGLAACAGGGAGGARPSTAMAAEGRAPAQGEFAPSAAPAPAYGADVGRCSSTGVFRKTMETLADAAKRAGRPAPAADGPICAVAETFLKWDPSPGAAPRPQVVAFVSRWFGLVSPTTPPSLAVFDTEDSEKIAERIVQAVGTATLNALRPRIGIASQRLKKDSTKVAVVLVDSPLELSPPFPKRLERGQKATLSGRLLAGLKAPQIEVSDATGQLSRPEQPRGDAFSAEISCGDRPGKIVVDVRGEVDGRLGLVASFPVACGAEPPASIAIAGEPWPTDPAEAERKILELVNQERAAAGIPPLTWDAGVATVARGISEDIAARGGAAGGDVAERLKREGIGSHLILQSAASDRTFERAHERLVSSPSNRANVMNREVTNLGVGAIPKTDAQGKPVVYVTEVFTKELAAADVSKIRRDLRAAVAQKRKDARTTPLAFDPLLDETAQKFAEALAAGGGTLPKEKQSEITAPLNKTMKTLSIVSGARPEPLDFAEEPQVTAVAKIAGVGVAQGSHPVLGRNAVYVVLMVGTPRADAEQPKREAVKRSRKTK